MGAFFSWLRSRIPTPTSNDVSSASSADKLAETLRQARELAQADRLHEASQTYWSIPPKAHTVETIVEHAELMLRIGDGFGAASRAARARELDPQNARACEVQRRVLQLEDEARRRT